MRKVPFELRWPFAVVSLVVALLAFVLTGPLVDRASAVPAGPVAVPVKVHIVTVVDGTEPLMVAGTVGATPTHRYDDALNGFAAELSSGQVTRLQRDSRVVDVSAESDSAIDEPTTTAVHTTSPQLTSYGQDRMGILQSRTAKVDGVDERVDVDVAVLDGGVDTDHPDLNVAGGVDCLRGRSYEDRDGHGTLVSGFIGALDNSFGFVGVAPGARIWAVRVARPNGVIPDSALLCGLEWVIDNADRIEVANLSLGDLGQDTGNCGAKRPGVPRDPVHAAICAAVGAGVTVVVAAGNESIDARGAVPAAYPEVITVSAFTETDGLPGGLGPQSRCSPDEQDEHIATFSNFGPAVDLAAPGECVSSTFIGGGYAASSGTSFAAPHVAGAAALVKARRPGATPAQVRRVLLQKAEATPLLGDSDGHDEGILNLSQL